jgi:hypothetical protein
MTRLALRMISDEVDLELGVCPHIHTHINRSLLISSLRCLPTKFFCQKQKLTTTYYYQIYL